MTVGTASQITNSTALLAVGPGDAFAVFAGCGPRCPSGGIFVVSHWNGKSWRKLLFPASLHGYVSAINSVRAIGCACRRVFVRLKEGFRV